MGASDPRLVTIPGRLLIATERWKRVICPRATLQDWRNSLPLRARRDNYRLRIITRQEHRSRFLSRAARSSQTCRPRSQLKRQAGRNFWDVCLSRVARRKQSRLTFRNCSVSLHWTLNQTRSVFFIRVKFLILTEMSSRSLCVQSGRMSRIHFLEYSS